MACKAPWPLPNQHTPFLPHHPTQCSHFPKCVQPHLFFSPFPVATFCPHINSSISSHPYHAPLKQAKGTEVNLFSLHFFQIHAHGFLTLGVSQSLTYPVFLTQALGLAPWFRCQGWLRYHRRELSRTEAVTADNQLVGSNCPSRHVPPGRWSQALHLLQSSVGNSVSQPTQVRVSPWCS